MRKQFDCRLHPKERRWIALSKSRSSGIKATGFTAATKWEDEVEAESELLIIASGYLGGGYILRDEPAWGTEEDFVKEWSDIVTEDWDTK